MPYGDYPTDDIESWRRIPGANEPRMEAEPSLLTKILRTQAGDLGIAPNMGMGLVMRGATADINAAKILEKMRELSWADGHYSLDDASPTKRAFYYIQAKYPKLANLVRGGFSEERLKDFSPTEVGRYKSSEMKAYVAPQDEQNAVESSAHEMTHALQDFRGRKAAQNIMAQNEGVNVGYGPEDMHPSARNYYAGRQWPGSPFAAPGRVDVNPSAYARADEAYGNWLNPFEVNARRGGNTAYDTYQSFLDSSPEEYRLPPEEGRFDLNGSLDKRLPRYTAKELTDMALEPWKKYLTK